MAAQSGTATRWARTAALPAAAAAGGVLLLCGAYAGPHLLPWAVLIAGAAGALARWGFAQSRQARHAVENGLLAAVGVLAIAQVAPHLQPLMYLLGAAYVLALPARLALPLLAALIGLDAALTPRWEVVLAHASFTALFASLYHALLGARLAASRRAEKTAVQKRVADVEERARELRLVATASDSDGRQLLAGVAEVEEMLRGALAVAEAALRPHA